MRTGTLISGSFHVHPTPIPDLLRGNTNIRSTDVASARHDAAVGAGPGTIRQQVVTGTVFRYLLNKVDKTSGTFVYAGCGLGVGWVQDRLTAADGTAPETSAEKVGVAMSDDGLGLGLYSRALA